MKNSIILSVRNLTVAAEDRQILININLTVRSGEVHAVMGPNGSGKSTLVLALMGHPGYQVYGTKPPDTVAHSNAGELKDNSKVLLNNENIINLPSDQRANKGLFLALQSPIAIGGVSVIQILRSAFTDKIKRASSKQYGKVLKQNTLFAQQHIIAGSAMGEFISILKNTAHMLKIPDELLNRGIHDGFSGGERKKIELLQALVLAPKVAMFDEIDTGLDVDALKIVAKGILEIKKKGIAILMVTHYRRILQYVVPDFVHVLAGGKIVASGNRELSQIIEQKGYQSYERATTN